MMKTIKTYAKINIPIYHRTLHVCVGDEQFTKTCKKLGISPKFFEEKSQGCVLSSPAGLVLYVGDTRTSDTLVHECVHVASFILELAGVPVSAKEDEALAYLVGYIWSEVVKKVGIV